MNGEIDGDTGKTENSGSIPVMEETLARLRPLSDAEGFDSARIVKIVLKPGWTAVIGSGGLCGTAFRFSGPHGVYEGQEVKPEDLQTLIGRPLCDVAAECLASPLIPLRSIAVASLSALSQPFLTRESLERRALRVAEDRSVIEDAVTPRDVVTLVGYGGMLQNLLGKCKELHVADMRPRDSFLSTIIGDTIDYEPREVTIHGAEDDQTIMGKSDVIIITASTLVNGTIDELLRFCGNARMVGLYGPSASVIPDVLFERGVHFVMSHHVQDPARFMESMRMDMNMEGALRKFQKYRTVLTGCRTT